MTISFRTRLFGLAALIVAVVLTVVLVLSWQSLLRPELERLENRLCLEARRVATQPQLGLDRGRLEADLRLRLRLGDSDALVLRLEPGAGLPAVQSRDAASLDLGALAWRPSPRAGPPPPRQPGPEGPPDQDPGPPVADAGAGAGAGADPSTGAPFAGAPGGPPERFDRPFPPPRRERDGPPPPRGTCELATATLQGGEGRAARYTTPRARAVVAQSLAPMKAVMQADLQRALQVLVPLALVLTAVGAWLLASLSLRPVNRLRNAMQGVTRLALSQRLASAGEDREFQELIAAYNTMLARLDASFQQATRFSADAAHELKTPLTILQGRLEQALHRAGDTGAPAAVTATTDLLSDMLDEVGRLAAITRKLLLLSQADAGQLALQRERVDLADLLDTLVADARMLAADQRVSSDIEPGLQAPGDALLLRQLFNNLLSNALRYGRADGWIAVSGRRQPGGVEVVFANATAALDAAQRSRFFDRFHRGDGAHSRAVDGHGLGLSLSREIARAHGGDLTLQASADDEVRLRLWLPGAV